MNLEEARLSMQKNDSLAGPLFEDYGDCRNKESVCQMMRIKCPALADKGLEDIRQLLESTSLFDEKKYYSKNFQATDSQIGAEYLWIPTAYANDKNERIYVQFAKNFVSWVGCFTGSATEIITNEMNREGGKSKKEMSKNLNIIRSSERIDTISVAPAAPAAPAVTTPTTPVKAVILSSTNAKASMVPTSVGKPLAPAATSSDEDPDTTNILPEEEFFYKSFYEKLLVKVGWSPSSIKTYLFTMIWRENFLLSTNKTKGDEYIIRSSATADGKKYAMMNTSLLNTFGNPIKLIIQFRDENSDKPLGYSSWYWTICDSKVTAIKFGFSKDDVNKELKPVVYYNDSPNELVFSADIDDFDLENEGRLEHCIDRKVERDQSGFSSMTDNKIYSDIVQAISTAISISRYDTGYIKPMYNRSNNTIHFVVPYHVNGSFEKAPEMGIIISKGNYGLWQVMTVLDYESVRRNCNCLSPYRASSF